MRQQQYQLEQMPNHSTGVRDVWRAKARGIGDVEKIPLERTVPNRPFNSKVFEDRGIELAIRIDCSVFA